MVLWQNFVNSVYCLRGWRHLFSGVREEIKRCVVDLDLNRESVSEPRTLSGRLFQSLGARYEKVLPPLVDFAILGTTKSPEFCDLRERVGL